MRCLQIQYADLRTVFVRSYKSVAAMIGALLMIVAVSLPAAVAQSPPQYELTWLGEGRPRDVNESELVVFGWSPYLYDYTTGIKHDLNQLSGASWIDLEDQANETGQWTVWHCNGINELNQIIGTASHDSGTESDRNFVLNDPLGLSPVFELLPTSVLDGSTYNVCINDLGEVAEGREINNSGVVAGGTSNGLPLGTVINSDGTFQIFDGHYFTGINEWGMLTGYRDRKSGRSGWGNAGPILFDYPGSPGPEDLIQAGGATNYHGDLNNLNDVAFSDGGRAWVYRFDLDSSFNLDNLIVNDSSSQAYIDWINTSILPSGINDKRQIIGQAQIDGVWNGFILNPVDPGPSIPTITVNDVTIDEGNDGTTTSGQFTITLSEEMVGTVMVSYTIVDGSATVADNDYSANPGPVVLDFAAGETSKTVDFTVIGDNTKEPDETFLIQLVEAVGGATITKGEGTATIKNDDKKGGGR